MPVLATDSGGAGKIGGESSGGNNGGTL